MKHTKERIVNAIKKWQKVAESLDDKSEIKEDDAAVKKSLKSKIKEGIETIGSAVSIAKSAIIVAEHVPETVVLIRELIVAINRGAKTIEKLNASRGIM